MEQNKKARLNESLFESPPRCKEWKPPLSDTKFERDIYFAKVQFYYEEALKREDHITWFVFYFFILGFSTMMLCSNVNINAWAIFALCVLVLALMFSMAFISTYFYAHFKALKECPFTSKRTGEKKYSFKQTFKFRNNG